MSTIKLEITSGRRSLGSVTLDKEQAEWLTAYALANESDAATMIKRAIHQVIVPEKRMTYMYLRCPANWETGE